MPRQADIRELLVCPICGSGDLRFDASQIACGGCGQDYDLSGDGIPILLEPSERSQLEDDYGSASQMRQEYRASPLARVRKLVKRALGSTHRLPRPNVVLDAHAEVDDGWVLEIGSGTTDSKPRKIHLDIGCFAGVDVVGSGCRLPFADGTFEMVRSLAVLEHVRDPWAMAAECVRVTKPGGYVYTEVPFLQHFHAYPNDFQRFTKFGLREAFRECEPVADGVVAGPSSAITALLADYAELWTFSSNRTINDLVRTAALVVLWPLKFMDRLLVRNPRAHEICSGVYLLARKPDAPAEEQVAAAEIAPQRVLEVSASR